MGHVEEVLLFNMLFSDCRYMPYLRRYSRTNFAMMSKWRFLAIILRPVFSASRVQHISDMHSKFALKPHHVSKYGIDIQCAAAEIRREKKEDRKIETTGQKYNVRICYAGQP